jgi:hypothetical protein
MQDGRRKTTGAFGCLCVLTDDGLEGPGAIDERFADGGGL